MENTPPFDPTGTTDNPDRMFIYEPGRELSLVCGATARIVSANVFYYLNYTQRSYTILYLSGTRAGEKAQVAADVFESNVYDV